MAYETPGAGAPAEMPAGGDAGEQAGEIRIPSDLLPPGIKEGDVLRCTSMDENGCSFEHEPAMEQSEGESWEADFRKEMSPQTPTSEAA